MAQERPLTPEKQLLKLIEDPKAKNTVTLSAGAIKHHSLSLFSFGAWTGRFSFLKGGLKKWIKGLGHRQLEPKAINHALEAGIFILTSYFISSLFFSMINLKKMPGLELKIPESRKGMGLADVSSVTKALTYYLEKVRARDIFNMAGKGAVHPESAVKRPSEGIKEVTEHLKLVGISWSNDPDAMIEDNKALKTFFVKRGQMIGEVKLQAIFKDKVVLSYNGEEIELR